MGERAARRYFMTGERFDAHRARELGLVSEVVAADELDTAVEGCIENLLANGPGAVAAAKQLVAELAGQPLSEALSERTCEIIAQIRVSGEGQQGLQAFLAKRTPPWCRQ